MPDSTYTIRVGSLGAANPVFASSVNVVLPECTSKKSIMYKMSETVATLSS